MKKKNPSIWDNFKEVFNYNPSTLSGALDVIVSTTPEKEYRSSSFHFRVGKFKAFKPHKKSITIVVNSQRSSFNMYFDEKGDAYFQTIVDKKSIFCSD